MSKGPNAFRTISEAADVLELPQHVLRFWESKFSFIRPMKRAGGRRFYRPQDIDMLLQVRTLLRDQGLTIKAVQQIHRQQGLKGLAEGISADPATIPEATVGPAMGTEVPEQDQLASDPDSGHLGPDERLRLQVMLRDLEAARKRLDALLPPRDALSAD